MIGRKTKGIFGSRRALVSVAAACVLLGLAPGGAARAAGVPAYRGTTGWRAGTEELQEIVIVPQGDRQRTLIRARLSPYPATAQTVTALVWIVPVPAPASNVTAQVARDWPKFEGVAARATMVQWMHRIALVGAASQLWPGPLMVAIGTRDRPAPLPPFGITPVIANGVEVTVLSGTSQDGLARDLAKRGVTLPPETLVGLGSYAESGHSFVVCRVDNIEEARKAAASEVDALAISIDSPLDRHAHPGGFISLKAGAALPSGRTDIRILTPGFMHVAEEHGEMSTVHYLGDVQWPTSLFEGSGTRSPDKNRFTELRMVVQPNHLTFDLSLERGAPRLESFAAFWRSQTRGTGLLIALGAVLLALVGVAAAIACRPVWPKATRPSPGATALLGLSHLLTVLGAITIALWLGRRLGAPRGRVVVFVVASSAAIVLANMVITFGITRLTN